jgi:hypothetical protein
MNVLAATATILDAEQTLALAAAPHSPVATTIATMEAAARAEAKWAATGCREAKPKVAKKVLSKEEKCVEAAKRRGRRRT